jgi:protein TonB
MSNYIGALSSYSTQADSESRSWWGAVAGSSVIYVALAMVAVLVGGATHEIVKEKSVDIAFVEKIAKPEPPPPAPPPVVEAPKPAPAAAPVIPKNMKVRKLDAPPKPKELVAPKEVPLEKPKEVDASLDKGIAVYGDVGNGDPAGLEGGVEGGVAGGSVGAIALPEDAEPPVALASNLIPPYPSAARNEGKTGTVILKVVIRADGSVVEVQVMRGEEPFSSAAVAAVKQWKYEPARFKGQPITVYQVIKIPFKLRA